MSAVLVTGGTGTTGSYLCEYLADAGADVVAASRSGAGPPGSRGVHFDWNDAETWDGALDDVDRVYLIAPAGASDPVTVMRPLLERAVGVGVRRAVLQSSSAIPSGGPSLGRVHAAVADTFPEWAVLRPSWFMQNFAGQHAHASGIRERGVITSATRGGRVGFIDVRDIARVAVRTLLDDVALNSDAILTGPSALSYADVAAIIGQASGRTVTHVDVDEDQLRALLANDGLPEDYAAMLATLDGLIASGAEDRVTDSVTRLTGTPPRSLEAFANETSWG